jgi:hypothetical protein
MRIFSPAVRVAFASVAVFALVAGPVDATQTKNPNRGNSGNSGNAASTKLSCTPKGNAPKGTASFLVEFKTGVTDAAIDAALRTNNGQAKRFSSAGVGTITFPGRGQANARNVMTGLANIIQRCEDDQEIAVAPSSVVSAAAVQSPATSWGLDRIDQRSLPLNNTYSYATTGTGVDVYVVDTGVLSTHTEFSGRMRSGFAASGLTGTEDCNGHGTHVAGTAAGATYGIAPSATVVPVRVLDCNGSGSLSGVISGIDWAIQDHTTTPAVMNLSLGGGLSGLLDAAVQRAVEDGITVVVAAGNSNANACNYSPAAAPNAITVGSTTTNDSRSSFSNYGDCIDVFAPGSAITSAWHTSTTAKNTISGTSMAAPHVAGVAARLLSANPTFTPAQITTVVQNTATPNVVIDARSAANLLLFADADTTTVTPPPTNGGGTGDGSGTTPGDGTQITAPETPNTPTATAGDRSARVQWTNNDDGGSTIIGHSLRVFEGTRLISELSLNARTDVTVTGLRVGSTYTFRVAAINSVGRSAFSNTSNPVTPVRVVGSKQPKAKAENAAISQPGKVRSLRVQVRNSQLITSWRFAKSDIGTNTDFLVVVRGTKGSVTRLVVSDSQGISIAGLPRDNYIVRVRAFNPLGSARAVKASPISVR